jgi:gamma-glutamylcyclotransferase (GGCT)/AIG2-like uncharacterized protein YtfP
MLYFAYGSDLDPAEMNETCPGHQVVGVAVLHDHRLGFPLYSHPWEGGVAGLVHAHGQKVWGVLHEVTEADLSALDAHEGWKGPGNPHNLYERETVTVELVRPQDGSAPRRVRRRPTSAGVEPSPPSRRYLDTLARRPAPSAAQEYVEWLGTIEPVAQQP